MPLRRQRFGISATAGMVTCSCQCTYTRLHAAALGYREHRLGVQRDTMAGGTAVSSGIHASRRARRSGGGSLRDPGVGHPVDLRRHSAQYIFFSLASQASHFTGSTSLQPVLAQKHPHRARARGGARTGGAACCGAAPHGTHAASPAIRFMRARLATSTRHFSVDASPSCHGACGVCSYVLRWRRNMDRP